MRFEFWIINHELHLQLIISYSFYYLVFCNV